jgi:hypothetical protein
MSSRSPTLSSTPPLVLRSTPTPPSHSNLPQHSPLPTPYSSTPALKTPLLRSMPPSNDLAQPTSQPRNPPRHRPTKTPTGQPSLAIWVHGSLMQFLDSRGTSADISDQLPIHRTSQSGRGFGSRPVVATYKSAMRPQDSGRGDIHIPLSRPLHILRYIGIFLVFIFACPQVDLSQNLINLPPCEGAREA